MTPLLSASDWTRLPDHPISRVALLQLNSQSDIKLNIDNTTRLIEKCVGECKPDIICTPENTVCHTIILNCIIHHIVPH